MRTILALLFVLVAIPAFALAPSDIVEICRMMSDPMACVEKLTAREQGYEMQKRQLDAQIEAARQQALGLALFGSGPALINGMNQGIQNMQVKPYLSPVPSR